MATSTQAAAAGNQVVGKVVILYGTVKAISPDGAVRLLVPNSPIFANDRIVTESDGNVSIMVDGTPPTQLDLGRMSNVAIDEDIYGAVTPQTTTDAVAEAEQIQKALMADGDSPIDLAATAAGGSAGAGGAHPLFVVSPTGGEVTPTSGADTTGVTFGTTGTADGALGQPAPNQPPTLVPDNNVATEGEGHTMAVDAAHGVLANDIHGSDGMTVVAGTHTGSLGGTLVMAADGSYSYTAPAHVDNPGGQPVPEVFTYTVTDTNGFVVDSTLTINITDTVPVAHPDSGLSFIEGSGPHAVDAAHGVLANDTASADGMSAVAGTFVGDHGGTIVLAADGSYTYTPPASVTNAEGQPVPETFTYTVVDGDGSTSSSTLTINVTDTAPVTHPDAGNSFVEGSGLHTVDAAHGVLANDTASADGMSAVAGTFVGDHGGTIVLAADGSYTYTTPASVTNAEGQPVPETFTYTVVDGDGSTSSSTLTINITDAVPTAHADAANVGEGATVTVEATGVLGNDVLGADGATLVGVVAGSDTTHAVNGQLGVEIAGVHGTLTLNADGSYAYHSTANDIKADTTDTFVYTIQDGDGDVSTTTLTINLADITVHTSLDAEQSVTSVDESALRDSVQEGPVVGTATAEGHLTATGGIGSYAYTLVDDTATATHHGVMTVDQDGHYSYTLHDVTGGDANTDTFSYIATDANGNTAQNTITISIVDDIPTAHVDTAIVSEGGTVTAVANGVLGNDVFGADGATLVGVAHSSDTSTPVSGNLDAAVNGAHGTLTLHADGSYSYHSTANDITADTTDTFVYTIQDGDGDVSTTTLTINLADSGVKTWVDATSDTSADEGALPGIGNHPGPGYVAEGHLDASGGTGIYLYALVGDTNGQYGTLVVNADGNYKYTMTHPTTTDSVSDTFTFQVTDSNGNVATNTVAISIVDDTPILNITNGIFQNSADTVLNGSLASIGADYAGGHVDLSTNDGVKVGVTSYGVDVVYHKDATDSSILHAMAGSAEVLTVTGHPDGTYTMAQHQLLDLTVLTSNLQSSIGSGGPQSSYYIYTDGTFGSVATAKAWSVQISADSGHGVNPSQQGMGIDNNHFDSNEHMRFNFDNEGASGAKNFAYKADIGVNGLSSSETINWTAHFADAAGNKLTTTSTGTASGTDHISITSPSDGVFIDYVDFTAGAGTDCRLTTVATYTLDTTVTKTLSFGFAAYDGDGNHVDGSVSMLAQNSATLTGGAGNEALGGGHDANIINGGAGNDTLTGGAGADIFHTGAGNDTIKDFSLAQGDKLIIEPAHDDIFVHQSGANVILTVSNSSAPVGTVTIENASAVDINNLLHPTDPTSHL